MGNQPSFVTATANLGDPQTTQQICHMFYRPDAGGWDPWDGTVSGGSGGSTNTVTVIQPSATVLNVTVATITATAPITVQISGTTVSDNMANPSAPSSIAFNMVFDEENNDWDKARGTKLYDGAGGTTTVEYLSGISWRKMNAAGSTTEFGTSSEPVCVTGTVSVVQPSGTALKTELNTITGTFPTIGISATSTLPVALTGTAIVIQPSGTALKIEVNTITASGNHTVIQPSGTALKMELNTVTAGFVFPVALTGTAVVIQPSQSALNMTAFQGTLPWSVALTGTATIVQPSGTALKIEVNTITASGNHTVVQPSGTALKMELNTVTSGFTFPVALTGTATIIQPSGTQLNFNLQTITAAGNMTVVQPSGTALKIELNTITAASAVPISPKVMATPKRTATTVSTSGVTITASNTGRKYGYIVNSGVTNVWVDITSTVATSGANIGAKLRPGGSLPMLPGFEGEYFGISDAAGSSQNIYALEVEE